MPEVADADLLPLFAAVLDDGRSLGERRAALEAIAAAGDPRALPFLAAQADRGDPALAAPVARAALRFPEEGGCAVVQRVLRAPGLPRAEGPALVDALGATPTDACGDVLWEVAGDRGVPNRLRARAAHVLRGSHPGTVDRRGPAPVVPEVGGTALVLTSGATAGGVVLGSVGELAAWDGGAQVGAVGGAAVGAGLAGLRLLDRPATTADGWVLGSGVAWGVTAGVWLPNAIWGSPRYAFPDPGRTAGAAAGVRAVTTLGGATAGWVLSRGRIGLGDAVETDLAGYLAQATTGGLASLAFPTPQAATRGTGVTGVDPFEEARRSSRRYAAAELVGAAAGLGAGAVLAPRWELSLGDAAFAAVVGAEGAALGATVPAAVGVDGDDLRGLFWFSSHGGALAGLALAEWVATDPGRTLATASGGALGHALGAGIPLLQGFDDPRAIAQGTAPVGLAGLVAGWALEPALEPSAGDAAMIGVSTAIVGSAGLFVGQGLVDVWADPAQAVGLGLVGAGVAGIGAWGLVPVVDARVDEALFVGSAAGLGAMFGGLAPVAADAPPATAWTAAGVGEGAATAVAAVLLTPAVGFEPRRALVPEVATVTGGTLGGLGVALVSPRGRDVATGTLIGATAGLGAGAIAELLHRPPAAGVSLRPPGLPSLVPSLGRTEQGTLLAGVRADRW